MFTKKRFRRNLAQGFFLERFGSAKTYKLFVCMVMKMMPPLAKYDGNGGEWCQTLHNMLVNGGKWC